MDDWDKVTGILAATEPWWEPGSASGYHALTFGYLVGEVIRRVSGRSVGRFVAEEIAGPLGADVHIGLDDADIARCAQLSMDAPPPDSANAAMFAQLDPAALAALMNPSMAAPLAADIACTERWRRAEIPAANGHATARALATVYAPLANDGEHAGVRLLSAGSVARGPRRAGSGGRRRARHRHRRAGDRVGARVHPLRRDRDPRPEPAARSGTAVTADRSGWPIRTPACRSGT